MRSIALASLLSALAAASVAQDSYPSGFGAEVGLSTLGAYVAPEYSVTSGLRIRAPLYFGSLSRSFEDDGGMAFDASVDVLSGALMADYYVGGSGFRVSGGLSFGGYEASARLMRVTLDGRTFDADFRAELTQGRAVAPVLAAGYRRGIGTGWGVTTELGIRVTDMELSVTGQEALPASERASFDRSIAGINEDLDEIGVLPFVSIGLSYAF